MRTSFVTVAAVTAVLAIGVGAACACAGAVAWRDLANNPGRYIGKDVEIVSAYCGNAGDDPGYVCSTDGSLYVRPLALVDGAAKAKLDDNCGGMDWIEKSPFCHVKLRFTPSAGLFNALY